jgi:Carboxypeptidase regulatory-like domain
MHKQIFSLLLRALVLGCSVDIAVACTCMSTPSPCESFKDTPVVFVGLVTSIEENKIDIVRFGEKQTIRTGLLARFTVEEPLKGINQTTVEVATGGGSGDCGYPFKQGRRYLVYAYQSEGEALNSSMSRTVIGGRSGIAARLSANICSRTRPLENATDDVELLQGLVKGKRETRLFGTIDEHARKLGRYEYDIERVGPMSNVKVIAHSANNRYETTTDQNGRYRISALKPGKYKLSVLLPEGYSSLFDFYRTTVNLDIGPDTCVERSFEAQIDGRIGGQVLDANGRPVQDQVQVSIVTLESSTKGMARVESRSEYTKKLGWYEFDGLLPGKYLLGISIANAPARHTPYPTIYYPDTADRAQARVFTLERGQKLTNIDFRLPSKLTEISLSGIAVDVDGVPVAEAEVDIIDQEDPDEKLFGEDVRTDKQGRFTIRGFIGRRYFLHAWKAKDYFAGTGAQSELIPVDTNVPTPTFKLVLNQPGIFLKKQN